MLNSFLRPALPALLFATAALSSCAESPQAWADWEAQYMDELTQPIPARFWVAPDSLDRIPDVMEHPCDGLVAREVTSIPRFSEESPFSASPVAEIDAQGNVISEWGVPVQSAPVDVAGDWLLVRPEDSNLALIWVATDGTIRSSKNIPTDWGNSPSEGVCPVEQLDFDPWCISMTDRHDGRSRLIVAETICT